MLSSTSMIGSIVDVNAVVLRSSGLITKDGISNRRELLCISTEGLLFKATIWGELSNMDIPSNVSIQMKRFRVKFYRGKTLTSMAISSVRIEGPSNTYPSVRQIFSGEQPECVSILRTKAVIGTLIYGFAKGKLAGFEPSISYDSCLNCHRKQEPGSTICMYCSSVHLGQALKVSAYILNADEMGCEKVSFFSETIGQLLSIDTSVINETVLGTIREKLTAIQERMIGFHVKVEARKREVDSKEVSIYFFTAQSPVFLVEDVV